MPDPIEITAPTSAAAAAGTGGLSPRTGSDGGDAATFDALVERAVGGRVGQLVRNLPGEATAAAWGRWQPSNGALGSRGGAAIGLGAGGFAAGSSIGGAGVIGAGGVGRSGGFAAGATGEVFPVAANVGEAVVNAAAEHLGVPYLWGGTDAEHGFDCSGLIQDAYRRVGVDMPKWSRHQAEMGVEVPSIEEALPGDIIAFGDPVDHVGLYVGDGQMLHAPRTGDVVKISDIQRPIATIRRVVSPTTPAAVGPTPSSGPTSRIGAALGVGASAPAGPSSLTSDTPYAELFESAGRRHDVDPALLAAVARAESAFNPRAVSPVGAQGLMQFMPATAREMGVDPWDPASAIDGAARYLRNSLDRFGSVDLAVASYNAGPGAVARYDGIPPFPETQNYVRTVLDTWRSRS